MTSEMVKKRKKKGFTLIELIIVLAIMAILAAIAVPSFNSIRDNSKVKADNQSKEAITRAINVLVADTTVSVNTTTAKTITITFNSSGVIVTPFTYSASFPDTSSTAYANETAAIESALADVKKPQASGVSRFVVTIATNGTVSTVTS